MCYRVIIDAETGLLAHQAQRHKSNELCKVQRVSVESQRSFGEKPRVSSDGSQGGCDSLWLPRPSCHRLSRESSGANHLPLSCRQSLEAPSIGRKASTTVTEGLLPSVTESHAPLVPEQEVPTRVPIAAEACPAPSLCSKQLWFSTPAAAAVQWTHVNIPLFPMNLAHLARYTILP